MAELADAADLKSADSNRSWGFKSPSGHHRINELQEKWPPRLGGHFLLVHVVVHVVSGSVCNSYEALRCRCRDFWREVCVAG